MSAHTSDEPDPADRLNAVLGQVRPPGLPKRAAGVASPGRVPTPAAGHDQPAPARPGSSAGEPQPAGRRAAAPRLIGLARAHTGTIGVIMVVALVLTGSRLMAAQGHDVPTDIPSPVITPATTTAAQTPVQPSAQPILVHVLGAVMAPGVVSLPSGARVADAITAAGGLSAEADCGELNLAAPVPDGAQIVIGTSTDPGGEIRAGPASSPGGQSGAGASSTTLDLNTATAEQLEALPGIGPVTAKSILDWREANGGFTRIEELQEVDGIGPKTFESLAPLVHV